MDQVRDPGNHSPYVPLVMTLESHRRGLILVAQEPMGLRPLSLGFLLCERGTHGKSAATVRGDDTNVVTGACRSLAGMAADTIAHSNDSRALKMSIWSAKAVV